MHADRFRTKIPTFQLYRHHPDINGYPSKVTARPTRFCRLLTTMSLLILLWGVGTAQSQSYYSHVSQDGYALSKLVTDTLIKSGRVFEYSITFSIPPNATNVVVSDDLMNTLEFVSSSYSVGQSCSPGAPIASTVSAPLPGTRGGSYSIKIPNAGPCGATGSISLFVRFPCGVTCNGASARNRACISYDAVPGPKTLCTGFLTTIAQAVNPWHVKKSVVGGAHQGGACPNGVSDSIVTYKIKVYKDLGTEGELNLHDATVYDQLPTGAYLRPGSSSCAVGNGSNPETIRWDVPDMAACLYSNQLVCTFDVVYPRSIFPTGTQTSNSVDLIGFLGDSATRCGEFVTSDTICIDFKAVTSGGLTKKVVTNGQPGCAGTYYLIVCNTGNQPLNGVIVADSLPSALSYGTPILKSAPNLWTVSTNASEQLTLSSNGQALPVGACDTVIVPFTIPVGTPPGTITNCATLTATGAVPRRTCVSFAVIDPNPQLCIYKSVCKKKAYYSPGETFTYRLRILNIGGEDLVGGTITDVLNGNLQFVPGTVRAYMSSALTSVADTCGRATDGWGAGVTTTPPTGGNNTVLFTLPTIPFNCDAAGNCGQNGATVPYYILEFDVRIIDSTVLGNIPNLFTVSDDGLPAAVESNTVSVLVSALTRYWIDKEVRPSGSQTFGPSATVTAGANVDYRLRLGIPTNTPRFASLRHVSFIDELPQNNGANITSPDQYLMMCLSRGSRFELTAQSFSSPSNPAATSYHESTGVDYPRIGSWGVAPSATLSPFLTSPLFIDGCSSTASTWATGLSPGDKNVGFYFGPYAFTDLSSPAATVILTSHVDGGANPGDSACNTFVAGGAVRRLINGTLLKDIPISERESMPVCIMVDSVTDSACARVVEEKINCRVDDNGNVLYDYCVTYLNTSPFDAYYATGTAIEPAGVTVTPDPNMVGIFSPQIPPGSTITLCYVISGADAGDVVGINVRINMLDLGNPEDVCFKCEVADTVMMPDCPLPTECCPADFIKSISDARFTLNNTGVGTITGILTAGPVDMQSVKVTLLNAHIRGVPAIAQIAGGTVDGSSGSVLPMHEISFGKWAPCRDMTTAVPFTINVLMPTYSCPPGPMNLPQLFSCPERDSICLRIEYVDCDCRVCDTVICLATTRVRRMIWRDWERRRFSPGRNVDEKEAELTTAATGDEPMIGTILSNSSAELAITFPEPLDENVDVTYTGIRIAPVDSTVAIIDAMNDRPELFFAAGGDGFGVYNAMPGEEMHIELTYEDFGGRTSLEHDVTITYRVDGEEQQEMIRVVFYRDGQSGDDELVKDSSVPVDEARTMGLHLQNLNGASRPIDRLALTASPGVEILAVGPTAGFGSALLELGQTAGGRAVVGEDVSDFRIELQPGETLLPIYVTVRGGDASSVLTFTTIDADGNTITEGELQIPSSVIEGDDDITAGGIIMESYPNPTNATSTLELYMPLTTGGVELTIVDATGRIVQRMLDDARLTGGTHLFVVDTSTLPNGTYLYVVRSELGTVSHTMRIVR